MKFLIFKNRKIIDFRRFFYMKHHRIIQNNTVTGGGEAVIFAVINPQNPMYMILGMTTNSSKLAYGNFSAIRSIPFYDQ